MHARRKRRVNNLTDVLHRALDSSDAFLSSILLQKIQVSSFTKRSNYAFGGTPVEAVIDNQYFELEKN